MSKVCYPLTLGPNAHPRTVSGSQAMEAFSMLRLLNYALAKIPESQ